MPKEGIHPNYHEIRVVCACGNSFATKSTHKGDIHAEICSTRSLPANRSWSILLAASSASAVSTPKPKPSRSRQPPRSNATAA
jgi:hypothetical protein